VLLVSKEKCPQSLLDLFPAEYVSQKRWQVGPKARAGKITSCTNVLHCCLYLISREHSTTVLFDQSTSVRLRLGLLRSLPRRFFLAVFRYTDLRKYKLWRLSHEALSPFGPMCYHIVKPQVRLHRPHRCDISLHISVRGLIRKTIDRTPTVWSVVARSPSPAVVLPGPR